MVLRFATEVRGERFHNPDDVFIVDDTSGETVSEASIKAGGVIETIPEPAPTSDVHASKPGPKDEISTLFTYVSRWQLRHAHLTLRGGQRLTSTVERSLGQLVRLMEYLQRSKLLDQDIERILEDIARAVEQVRRVREGLQQAEVKLQFVPPRPAPESEQAALDDASAMASANPPPQARKRARAKA